MFTTDLLNRFFLNPVLIFLSKKKREKYTTYNKVGSEYLTIYIFQGENIPLSFHLLFALILAASVFVLVCAVLPLSHIRLVNLAEQQVSSLSVQQIKSY